jgi:hypothetical protein
MFAGLREAPPQQMSLLLFILFMLSSTAYDGLHETLPFVTIFWRDLYPLLTAGSNRPYVVTVNYYYYWQWTMLLVWLFVYLVVYLFFVALGKALASSRHGFGHLACAFMYSLVPIAFVYNVTHYFTLLASQGIQILRLVSDPFGFGWNLLGTARWVLDPLIIDAGVIWHMQVGLIVVGHIIGVYLAHVEALVAFAGTRRAVLSQLPMLFLMVLFTTAGLWILSLPIAAGQVLQPPASGKGLVSGAR